MCHLLRYLWRMLALGSLAPEIDAESSDGPFRLSRRGGPLCTVVYFFPKAFTPACTRETLSFRDNYGELVLAGAALVGVSTDNRETQCKFAESTQTPFPIVSDPAGAVRWLDTDAAGDDAAGAFTRGARIFTTGGAAAPGGPA